MKHTALSLFAATAFAASAIALPSAEPAGPTSSTGPGVHRAPLAPRIDFRREFIPANATLIAHLDITSFNKSTFGKLFAESRDQLEIEELDNLEKDLGFDPFRVLHSITAFGTGTAPEPNTAVVLASGDVDPALLKLQEDDSFALSVHDGIEVFEYQGTFGYVEEAGANRVIVLSDALGSLVAAAQVVRGEAESLREVEGAESVGPVAGSFFFLAATEGVPGMDEYKPASKVFGLAEGLQLDLGEAGGSIFAHLGIATGDANEARDVVDIVQALITITRISGLGEMPGVSELLYALRVSARGGMVSVDFEFPVEQLAEVLEEALQEAGGRGRDADREEGRHDESESHEHSDGHK